MLLYCLHLFVPRALLAFVTFTYKITLDIIKYCPVLCLPNIYIQSISHLQE